MRLDAGGERDGGELRAGEIEVRALSYHLDSLSDLLLRLTLCSLLADLEEQPRKLTRFSLGYLAIGPRFSRDRRFSEEEK